MPKNVFIYPCDTFVGSSIANAFSAAGHAVSGLAIKGGTIPLSVKTIIRANDHDAVAAQKQLLLTADVVIFDLLGNERATRDAVVQLAQQPYGGREVLFVAVSSPLVWAATRPNPAALFAAAAGEGVATENNGEWGGGEGPGDDDGLGPLGGEGADDAPWPGAGHPTGSGAGTGSGDGEDLAGADSMMGGDPSGPGNGVEDGLSRPISPSIAAPTFRAPDDVPRRLPAAAAREALAVEHLVLRAGRRGRLRTAVVCPGLLYGEGEDDLAFCNAFKAAWTWQCRPTQGFASATAVAAAAIVIGGKAASTNSEGAPPRLLVYGRGTNVIPTLHVADLAAYVLSLVGAATPTTPTPGGSTATAAVAAGVNPSSPSAASLLLAPSLAPGVGAAVPTSTAGNGAGASGSHTGGVLGSSLGFGGGSGGGGGSGHYLLVTDGSRCTQAELMTAIAAAFGVGADEGAIQFIPESELHLHPAPLRSRMLLDLSFATTPLPASTPSAPPPTFTLSRPGGLPAHLADVVSEFRSARNLTPLRLLVTGPPLSGKTHLARRLAQRYGLSYISVPLLLAAASDPVVAAAAGLNPAMDPSLLRQAQLEVAAGPSSLPNPKEKEKDKDKDKEGQNPGWLPTGGRVSARTLGALLASALGDPRCAARCRGFVLDGFPRSAAQARAAFYTLQVDEAALAALAAEQSHGAKLGAHKSHRDRNASLVATPSTPNVAAALTVTLGGCADIYDLPSATKLVPNPLTAPTHVIELDVGEEELRARMTALTAAADEAVTRMAAEAGIVTDDRKGLSATKKPAAPSAGPAGKGGLASGVMSRDLALAAALGHNTETGFVRRMAAYSGWRAEDAADLRSSTASAQAAWEAERARQEAERIRLAAEASTLKAKRRRARAAAVAAATGIAPEDEENDIAAGNIPDAGSTTSLGLVMPDLVLPQHGGLMALSLSAGSATYMRLSNPTIPAGPLLTITIQPPTPAVLMTMGTAAATSGSIGPTSIAATVSAAMAQTLPSAVPPNLPPLASLERSVEVQLGPPHNLVGFPEPGATAIPETVVEPTAATPALGAPLAVTAPSLPPPAPASFVTVASYGKVPVSSPYMSSGNERLDGGPPAAAAAGIAEVDGRNQTQAPQSSLSVLPPMVSSAAAALASQAEAVEAGAEASYAYRWHGSRGAAVRRYLLHHVIPVVTAALAEVALARMGGMVPPGSAGSGQGSSSSRCGTAPNDGLDGLSDSLGDVPGQPMTTGALGATALAVPGPGSTGKDVLLHVARSLAIAADAVEEAFQDPYSDPSYAIQLAKIDAKAAREAARAASAAAKAEREAAARQQLHVVKEDD